jgi:hypothetical protein
MARGQKAMAQIVKIIPEVDEAALKYADIRDERMALTKQEVEAREELLRIATEHKITDTYKSDEADLEVIVSSKQKVKVKRAKDGDGEE